MVVSIASEDPTQPDIRELIAELNDVLLELTPPKYCYHMTSEEMAREDTSVFVARDDEQTLTRAGIPA